MTKKKFQVKGMYCSACVMAVEGALEDLVGVKTANADYVKETAEVEYDQSKVTEAEIIEAIQKEGFSVAEHI